MRAPNRIAGLLCALCVLGGFRLEAQQPATPAAKDTTKAPAPPPLPGPPVRKIATASALSTEQLGAITSVRVLSDGRVLLNDGTRRRLLMLDTTLAVRGVVLDSLTEVENAYGTRTGALIAYRGDTTLFVDPATYAMLMIDGAGKIARVRSVPRAQDVQWLTSTDPSNGVPGFDTQGRLVYRIPAQPARPAVRPPSNVPYFPTPPDSAFVVGMHLDTRKLDTLASVRIPKVTFVVKQTSDGINVMSSRVPIPLVDDWAVRSDGSVAFVRGRDYRVEWLGADGTLASGEKLPFPWVRMPAEAKDAYVDSVRIVMTRNAQTSYTTNMIVWSNTTNKPYPKGFVPAPGYVPPNGFPKDWILPDSVKLPASYQYGCPPGVTPPNGGGGLPSGAVMAMLNAGVSPAAISAPPAPNGPPSPGANPNAPNCIASPYLDWYGGGYTPPPPTYRAPLIVRAEELPDYKPPFQQGSTRADADGNLWIRTNPMRPTPGGPVYDIVDRSGALSDRIQLPPGYQLVGFAPGKVVFLTMRDAKGLHLARVRLR